MTNFRLLPGLPAYGPLARAFPPEWGRLGREGIVVAFDGDRGTWTGNFASDNVGLCTVLQHPDGMRVLVLASGDLWCVDPNLETAEHQLYGVDALWLVPDGYVVNWQGLAFARFGQAGILWHTRRISWDGFRDVAITADRLTGAAWSPVDAAGWLPFEVSLTTGASTGGSYARDLPLADNWERLASNDGTA